MDKEQIKAEIDRVFRMAGKVAQDADATKGLHPEWCVNWAAFKPSRTMWFIDDTGDHGFIVTMDEASPDNWQLAQWMRERFREYGYDNVEVHFEW